MKAREFLTPEQKDFIKANYKKLSIPQMADKLGVPSTRIYHNIKKNNLNFKRVADKKRSDSFFKEGCFNPHERENWLV